MNALSLRRRTLSTLAAGVLFGLALLTKELSFLVIPFALGFAWVGTLPSSLAWRDLRRLAPWRAGAMNMLILVAASTGTVFAVSPDHFVMVLDLAGGTESGQFRGLFSELTPVGLRAWEQGVGRILFFGQVLGVLVLLVDISPKRKLCALLLLAEAALSGTFLTNNTSLHYRHFLWPTVFSLPVAALVALAGIGSVLERLQFRRWSSALALYAVATVTIGQSLFAVMPAVLLRKAYNPVAGFYEAIRSHGEDALVLGMDNCTHVEYFAELECRRYPTDVTAAEAQAFAAEVEKIVAQGRSVYLLPDFFGYDFAGHVRHAMQARFTVSRSETRWHEDYHTMDFGWSRGETRNHLVGDAEDCHLEVTEHAVSEGIGAPLAIEEIAIRCASAADRRVLISVTRGRVLPSLWKTGLQRLALRPVSGHRRSAGRPLQQ